MTSAWRRTTSLSSPSRAATWGCGSTVVPWATWPSSSGATRLGPAVQVGALRAGASPPPLARRPGAASSQCSRSWIGALGCCGAWP
eukprot:204799-Pyramimonas_sp.AAC.1